MPKFISVVISVAELAHGEKSRTQSFTQSLTHSPTLTDAPGNKAFALENSAVNTFSLHCVAACIATEGKQLS